MKQREVQKRIRGGGGGEGGRVTKMKQSKVHFQAYFKEMFRNFNFLFFIFLSFLFHHLILPP